VKSVCDEGRGDGNETTCRQPKHGTEKWDCYPWWT